jgi:glycerol-1-phosphate dehydrogenase [NAD(P)+]
MVQAIGLRSISVPLILEIGSGLLARVAEIVCRANVQLDNPVVVTGVLSSRRYAEIVTAQLRRRGCNVGMVVAVRGTVREAERLATTVLAGEVILAVGGGKVVDVAKLAAKRAGATLIVIPTAVAHDGISSPIASLQDDSGNKQSVGAVMPAGILVDSDIVGAAPTDTLRAGIGDLVSNLTAVLDWRLASERRKEDFDEFAASLAKCAALPVLRMASLPSGRDVAELARGLVLSGLAMAVAGTSRPCSGAEHLVSHSLDGRLGSLARMHGLQVAVSTLVMAAAHGRHLSELRQAYRRLGLPIHPCEIGLSVDDLADAVLAAPSIRPERYTVLNELDLSRSSVHELIRHAVDDVEGPTVGLIPRQDARLLGAR